MITIQNPSEFKPVCMATTLSTVPFRDAHEACRTMLAYFPEAPCIPKLSLSLRRYIDGMPCLVIDREKRRVTYDLSRVDELHEFYERCLACDLDHFAMNPEYAPGFYRFLEVIDQSPPAELKMIHIGLPGPLTWGLSMAEHQTGKPAWHDATMRDVLIRSLVMKAEWQRKKIAEVLPDVRILVSFGEPSLGVIYSPFGSVAVDEVMTSLDEVFLGIESLGEVHCCSNMDWEVLMRTRAVVINFDAYQYADKLALYPQALEGFLGRGGMLAWGIVPVNAQTLSQEDHASLLARLEKGVEMLVQAGLEKRLLLERSFITPCCDAGTLTPDETVRAWGLTREIARSMRAKYLDIT